MFCRNWSFQMLFKDRPCRVCCNNLREHEWLWKKGPLVQEWAQMMHNQKAVLATAATCSSSRNQVQDVHCICLGQCYPIQSQRKLVPRQMKCSQHLAWIESDPIAPTSRPLQPPQCIGHSWHHSIGQGWIYNWISTTYWWYLIQSHWITLHSGFM